MSWQGKKIKVHNPCGISLIRKGDIITVCNDGRIQTVNGETCNSSTRYSFPTIEDDSWEVIEETLEVGKYYYLEGGAENWSAIVKIKELDEKIRLKEQHIHTGDFIVLSTKEFSRDSKISPDYNGRTSRAATREQIDWLDRCIAANQYLPLKEFPRDWYVELKSQKEYNLLVDWLTSKGEKADKSLHLSSAWIWYIYTGDSPYGWRLNYQKPTEGTQKTLKELGIEMPKPPEAPKVEPPVTFEVGDIVYLEEYSNVGSLAYDSTRRNLALNKDFKVTSTGTYAWDQGSIPTITVDEFIRGWLPACGFKLRRRKEKPAPSPSVPKITIIEEAKQRYPVGTHFIDLVNNHEFIVRSHEGLDTYRHPDQVYIPVEKDPNFTNNTARVYKNGVWAKIVPQHGVIAQLTKHGAPIPYEAGSFSTKLLGELLKEAPSAPIQAQAADQLLWANIAKTEIEHDIWSEAFRFKKDLDFTGVITEKTINLDTSAVAVGQLTF